MDGLRFIDYADEDKHLPLMKRLIERDLSEPYSVFTFRYFVNNWPELAILCMDGEEGADDERCIGTVVCRLRTDKKSGLFAGYIAMLSIEPEYRKRGIATRLVSMAIERMREQGADVVVLEVESTNVAARRLYERLDFVAEKLMRAYYMNGGDAYRLKLWLKTPAELNEQSLQE